MSKCFKTSTKYDEGEHASPEPRQESSSCEDHMGQVGSGADGYDDDAGGDDGGGDDDDAGGEGDCR